MAAVQRSFGLPEPDESWWRAEPDEPDRWLCAGGGVSEDAPRYGDEGPDDEDRSDFADPGGRSALRRATRRNPRNRPCPTCGRKNVLTPADVARGYQCDACADRDEGTSPSYCSEGAPEYLTDEGVPACDGCGARVLHFSGVPILAHRADCPRRCEPVPGATVIHSTRPGVDALDEVRELLGPSDEAKLEREVAYFRRRRAGGVGEDAPRYGREDWSREDGTDTRADGTFTRGPCTCRRCNARRDAKRERLEREQLAASRKARRELPGGASNVQEDPPPYVTRGAALNLLLAEFELQLHQVRAAAVNIRGVSEDLDEPERFAVLEEDPCSFVDDWLVTTFETVAGVEAYLADLVEPERDSHGARQPRAVRDLDTGQDYRWNVRVELEAIERSPASKVSEEPPPRYGPAPRARARFEIEREFVLGWGERRLVVRDVGPWDKFPTVTNDADAVVAQLVSDGTVPPDGEVLYIDSEGERDRLRVVGGKFAGFLAGWGDR